MLDGPPSGSETPIGSEPGAGPRLSSPNGASAGAVAAVKRGNRLKLSEALGVFAAEYFVHA